MKPSKMYQLWHKSDYNYAFDEFDTIQECIDDVANHYTADWFITKRCDYKVYEYEQSEQKKVE